jgi:hypothetical protein
MSLLVPQNATVLKQFGSHIRRERSNCSLQFYSQLQPKRDEVKTAYIYVVTEGKISTKPVHTLLVSD